MAIGKPWSRGSGKPLMTLQQLAAETGCELQSIRAAIRQDADRPTPINKANGTKYGGEASSYYDADALRGWWSRRTAHQSKGVHGAD